MDSAVIPACPICEASIDVREGMVVGELVSCDECGTELEVIKINPIEIQEAPEVEEDWGE